MHRWLHISPVWVILHAFHRDGAVNYTILITVIAFCTVQAVLVAGGSYIDGTWYSASGGTGFLEHYGVWAVLISDPLLLISAAYAYRRFRFTMVRLPIVDATASKQMVLRVVKPHIDHLRLKRRGA